MCPQDTDYNCTTLHPLVLLNIKPFVNYMVSSRQMLHVISHSHSITTMTVIYCFLPCTTSNIYWLNISALCICASSLTCDKAWYIHGNIWPFWCRSLATRIISWDTIGIRSLTVLREGFWFGFICYSNNNVKFWEVHWNLTVIKIIRHNWNKILIFDVHMYWEEHILGRN